MPNGDLREIYVQPHDTIWHLHHMFKTHHELGCNKGSMVILPTTKGLYEMDADLTPENEFLSERNTASLTLEQYGFKKRGCTLAVFYLPYYKQETLVPLISSFMLENMDARGMNFVIPSVSHIVGIPDKLEEDNLQAKLVEIMTRQYFNQVLDIKAKYVMIGRNHKLKRQKESEERYRAAQVCPLYCNVRSLLIGTLRICVCLVEIYILGSEIRGGAYSCARGKRVTKVFEGIIRRRKTCQARSYHERKSINDGWGA